MISAVILSGGHSTRMGEDKAKLLLEGKTFLERIIDQFYDVQDIYLSVRETASYSDCAIPHIQDDYQECGPMGGIQKALTVCKYDNLFVTACDMPFMDSQFAFYLSQFLEDDVDAVVPVDRNGRKYVIGSIYHKRIKPVIEAQLKSGDKKLTHVLEKIRVSYVQLHTLEQEQKLTNINRQKEYKKLLSQKIPVISFVGYSNTGKTTLMEKIISILNKQGVRIAYIKHTHHQISLPSEGKDSQRMTKAGAIMSAVISPENTLIVENRVSEIDRLLQGIHDVDIILIEGYKQKDFPKIMVVEKSHYPVPLEQCLAVVSDTKVEGTCWFSRDDVQAISQFIIDFMMRDTT